ncbi:MFS transporter [Micromonospora rosaria]|uniref:MFS transporter n=1 Tax=Micromonospora rosaria TaxID=47874 RepID=UPI001FDF82E8|nr:MFS transporter [Micromonospora rosaria]
MRTSSNRRELLDWFAPAVAFAVNGAMYGTLLTRYPEIADRTQASETAFGVVLFASALGGLVGSLVAPALVRARGDFGATLLAGFGYAVLAVSVAWAPELIFLGLALLLMGVLDGAHDVGMNAVAVRGQQRRRTSLMGRMHATWSLSLTAAGVLGAAAAGLRVPVVVHVTVVTVVAVAAQVAVLVLRRRAGPADDDAPARTGPATTDPVAPGVAAGSARARRLRYVLPVLALAALAASYVESPGQEWTGLLLSRGLLAPPEVAAAAPVVFAAGLVASRLVLDVAVRRFGTVPVAAVAGATVLGSMLAGLAVTAVDASAWWALAAIAGAGLGAGPIFPMLFGAADHLSVRHGIAPARTASIVSALSRIGAISAPVVVGPLTETFGMAMVFAVMAVGGALVLLTLPRAAH